jgi:hypothetical protein
MKMPVTCSSIAPSVSDVVILLELDGDHHSSTCKHVSQAKANFSNLLLMEAFTTAAWQVGKQRLNGLIFHQTRPSIELKSRKLASFLISSEQCLPPLLAHHLK